MMPSRPSVPSTPATTPDPEVPRRSRITACGPRGSPVRCPARAARARSFPASSSTTRPASSAMARSSSGETSRSTSWRIHRTGATPGATFLVDRGQVDDAGRGVVARRRDLRDPQAGLRIRPGVLEDEPAVEPGEVVGVRQPDVDDGEAARTRGARRGPGARRAGVRGSTSRNSEFRAMNASAKVPPPSRRTSRRSASTSSSRPAPRPAAADPSRPVQHRRIEVDAGHVEARLGQRHGETPGAARELQDRATGARRERQVEVQVAGILDQVDVVQPGEGASLGPTTSSPRRLAIERPGRAWRFTASALIASRAARFAIIAVISAWSYGGDTSTMSIPASSTRPTIRRTARSSSRVMKPPGSGVPVPGASPGSTTSMSTLR